MSRILKKYLFLVVTVIQPLLVSGLYAAEQSSSGSGAPGTMDMIQVLIGLVAVVLFIIVLSVILRRMNIIPGASNNLIKILGGLAITSKDRILLIQVGEEQILVSASQGNISKIHKMKIPVQLEAESSTSPGAKSFSSLLEKFTKA